MLFDYIKNNGYQYQYFNVELSLGISQVYKYF